MTDHNGADYLPVESAGSVAGISPRTLRYWVKAGKLSAIAGPRGKLVRLADVERMAELTGKRPAPSRQVGGNAGNPARSADGNAGNVAEDDGGDQIDFAPSVAAKAQLEAIRDEWLQPLIDQIRALERENGRLAAERDAIAGAVDELTADNNALRAEVERLATPSPGPIPQDAESIDDETTPEDPPTPHPLDRLWRRLRGRPSRPHGPTA